MIYTLKVYRLDQNLVHLNLLLYMHIVQMWVDIT